MIDWHTAYDWLQPGDIVSVSDGSTAPATDSPAWPHWLASNFTGSLLEKRPGSLVFEAQIETEWGTGTSTFEIGPDGGHVFASATEVPSLNFLKAAKRMAVDLQAYVRSTEAFSWDFGDVGCMDDLGADVGAAGTQTLQIRDDVDKTNWLGAQADAVAAIMAGNPGEVVALKTTANVWVQTTAEQVIAVLVSGDEARIGLLRRQRLIMERYGALKTALTQAQTAEDVQAIDATAGWP